MDIISYLLSRQFVKQSLIGMGALKGSPCQIKGIVHQDGINTVTFEWEGTDGSKRESDMIVYDGTPIYVWESGNHYNYGDLAIYASCFYRCIQENSDREFDDTKWNEIGSPDGNYDIVQSRDLLPPRFTAADRKLYFVIDESVFYLWNGVQWEVQNNLVQLTELPTASATYLGKIYQYTGDTTGAYKHGYIYECVSDDDPTDPTYSWVKLSGSAELESAVTANTTVGGITSGTTLAAGTSLTELFQKLLIIEIAPTITFSASGSGVKEIGTSVTPTLTLKVTSLGTGTPTAIKFYDGSTLLDTQTYVSGTNTYTFTMADAVTTTKTVKGVLEYTKSDGASATLEGSATYTFVMASYYGAVTTAPTDKTGIIALTKSVKNTKALTTTFNLSNQRACYCYPASFGNLTSIKDANNFEYLGSYTKTNVTIDDVSYNVYTLTDLVTATGFKQVYA